MIVGNKPIKPPFSDETARAKVKAAQDAWNTKNPERVAQAYTSNSQWRNRAEFFSGREAIRVPKEKMVKRTRLPPNERALVLYRKSNFCAFRIRMERC